MASWSASRLTSERGGAPGLAGGAGAAHVEAEGWEPVDRLTRLGLLERLPNPGDRRGFLVGLTPEGLRRLRESQVTHHRGARATLSAHLDARDLKRLGGPWEKAIPGAAPSPTWPL